MYMYMLFVSLFCMAFLVEAKLVVEHVVGELSKDQVQHGKYGFGCLENLFGDEGRHILHDYKDLVAVNPKENHDDNDYDQLRYEAIYVMFGADGVDTICDTTLRLRKARLLQGRKTKPMPTHTNANNFNYNHRNTQYDATCIPSEAYYPADNDPMGEYNEWAQENVDPFLPEGADRTSRTDPAKLVRSIQDTIDVSLEAEYASMACHPIVEGIQALATIPDAVFINQGAIIGSLKSFICGFSSRTAAFATNTLYSQMARAQAHDFYIDAAESSAAYMNTANMVNTVCTNSNAQLSRAVEELSDIKRALETRFRV
ncbi:expressed unknown protein [Seminavis robusta]|uniref:Uncharacterized protein n=1 Tax=Seminavis robusta TaxID=568900 RepID=A0A9N8DLJ8_9STRA|nr:expressed unknown protein [Seminavis robusta]|eukprot:Sro209_g087350.1 n/a (314) ;mRNA; r:50352-51406